MENGKAGRNIYIGLMSGTSADGIDAAAVEITGAPEKPLCRLLAYAETPYDDETRALIFRLFDTERTTAAFIAEMNFRLGRLYGAAAAALIAALAREKRLDKGRIAAIGSHGQTVFHAPDGDTPCTLQIGEGSVIAEMTGVTCVSDFRVADIAAGGMGAPLVPFADFLLFSRPDKSLILQNIGGIANSTVLPAGCSPDEVFAFDNGPGNMLVDALTRRFFALPFDRSGDIAASGAADEKLLDSLLQEPYYAKSPPKTTGRELFGEAYAARVAEAAAGLAPRDVIATATLLTARVIADSYRDHILPRCRADELIVSGGGSYNKALLRFLGEEMGRYGVAVSTQEDKGFRSDAKEATAFALLAYRTLQGLPNSLPGATGARHPAVLGKISPASARNAEVQK